MPNETDGIIKRFEQRTIRSLWDEERQEWYFSIVDVVGALTDSPDYQTGRKYWNKLKQRLHEEGSELVTNCHQFRPPTKELLFWGSSPLAHRARRKKENETPWRCVSCFVRRR